MLTAGWPAAAPAARKLGFDDRPCLGPPLRPQFPSACQARASPASCRVGRARRGNREVIAAQDAEIGHCLSHLRHGAGEITDGGAQILILLELLLHQLGIDCIRKLRLLESLVVKLHGDRRALRLRVEPRALDRFFSALDPLMPARAYCDLIAVTANRTPNRATTGEPAEAYQKTGNSPSASIARSPVPPRPAPGAETSASGRPSKD